MVARLKLEQLSCVRGGRQLFAEIDADVEAGGALFIMGPNGVGKSSLIRIIAGLLPAQAGRLQLDGRIALADRSLGLDPQLPLMQALHFWSHLDNGQAEQGLAAMDLMPLARVPVRMLSSGQRQRAVLARVIASRADIWLLDEPTNALDLASVARLELAITAHRQRGGIAVVASHAPLNLPDARLIELRSNG
jgi:heme exporter protein A